MPTYRITAPNGKKYDVTGDGTAQDALAHIQQQWTAQNSASPNTTPEAPNLTERVGRGMMDVVQGFKQSMKEGEEQTAAHEQAVAAQLGQPATQRPVDPNRVPAADYTARVNSEIGEYEKGRGPDAGIDAARLGGNVAAVAPMAALAPAAGAGLGASSLAGLASGAAQGAMQFDPTGGNERGQNAVIGGAIGGILPGVGAAGKKLLGGAQDSMKQGANKLIELAKRHGIPLDSAQQTGRRALEYLQSVTGKFPFSGEQQFQRTQKDAYNKAIAGTMGAELPDGQFNKVVMDKAAGTLGSQFEKISGGKAVDVTPRIHQAIREIEADNGAPGTLLHNKKVAEAVELAKTQFADRKMVSGQVAQEMRSKLTTMKNDLAKQGASKAETDALRKMRDAVDDSIEDVLGPDESAAWKTAKQQYGNYKTISQALAGTAGDSGDVSGVQLWNAVKSGVGRNNMARSSSDLKELAELGKDVLKPKVGDSHTAQRVMYQSLFGIGGAAVGAHEGHDGGSAAVGGALGTMAGMGAAALTSRTLRNQIVAKLLREGVLPKNATGSQIANVLRRYGVQPALVDETTN